MDVRHLRSFVAVAEERHFARAAERLNMAQPPLSQQIRRMETELGALLFQRTTRRVDLTAAGVALLPRAREILSAVQGAVDEARRAAAGETGRIVVASTGSATYAMLPAVAGAVHEALPGLHLELRGEVLTPAQVRGLLDGSIDIGILRPPVRSPEIVVQIVSNEPLVAILPAAHRLAGATSVRIDDLACDPFVAYVSHHRSVLHDAIEHACERHGFVPKVAVEAGETATLVSLVAAGIGVALAPASVAHLPVVGAVFRRLDDENASVELALAWRRDDRNPAVHGALRVVRVAMAGAMRRLRDPDELRLDSDGRSP